MRLRLFDFDDQVSSFVDVFDRRNELGACVQILDITSHYRWEGAVARDAEVLLLIKTSAERYRALEAWLVEHHPYDLPEILALPVAAGLADYLSWVGHETGV